MSGYIDAIVKVDGREFKAHQCGVGGSYWVLAKDVCSVARKDVKKKYPKARCRLSAANSIQVTLPLGTPREEATRLRHELAWAAGATFDGMQDLEESIEREANGQRIYFHSKYVFVDIAWN